MPREAKVSIKVTQRTAALMALAADQLGTTVPAMTEQACLAWLNHEARQMFEADLSKANRMSSASMKPTIKRHEFEIDWAPPAWKP